VQGDPALSLGLFVFVRAGLIGFSHFDSLG
jgi:hypothetical protein